MPWQFPDERREAARRIRAACSRQTGVRRRRSARYAAVDFLCSASDFETFGNTCAEARGGVFGILEGRRAT